MAFSSAPRCVHPVRLQIQRNLGSAISPIRTCRRLSDPGITATGTKVVHQGRGYGLCRSRRRAFSIARSLGGSTMSAARRTESPPPFFHPPGHVEGFSPFGSTAAWMVAPIALARHVVSKHLGISLPLRG